MRLVDLVQQMQRGTVLLGWVVLAGTLRLGNVVIMMGTLMFEDSIWQVGCTEVLLQHMVLAKLASVGKMVVLVQVVVVVEAVVLVVVLVEVVVLLKEGLLVQAVVLACFVEDVGEAAALLKWCVRRAEVVMELVVLA